MRARFLEQCPQQIQTVSNRVPTGQHTFSNLENTGGAGNWAPGHTQFTHTDEIDKASMAMGQPTRVRVRERPTGDSVAPYTFPVKYLVAVATREVCGNPKSSYR